MVTLRFAEDPGLSREFMRLVLCLQALDLHLNTQYSACLLRIAHQINRNPSNVRAKTHFIKRFKNVKEPPPPKKKPNAIENIKAVREYLHYLKQIFFL